MKPVNIIFPLLILLIFSTISFSQTNEIEQTDKQEVIGVLQQFQDGYTNRDTTIIDEFLKLFTSDIVYMGVASHEFFKGKESVRKLTLWDWERWFDLKIPIEKIDIRIANEVAWFEVVGESGPWRNGKTYEIRMVGSLIKSENNWLFKQICFSYPAPLKEVE
ncbi:MAG: nuclear transport factor 2 family protein [Bacteroidales bacterium]|nr:nuclear transport factor 2 family protein [Bacteroidales bacterium]